MRQFTPPKPCPAVAPAEASCKPPYFRIMFGSMNRRALPTFQPVGGPLPDDGLRVLFVDMNAYFASVEQQMRPRLRGRPVAVAALDVPSTACIACSYEAKRFGIKTGTPVAEARRVCPSLVVLAARPEVYVRVHEQVREAVESCLPIAAVESIDEMYGHLAPAEWPPSAAENLARRVKQAIYERAGRSLTCSIGLAPNRFLAKVATDMQKPDGLVTIRGGDLPDALYGLELVDLPGIGKNMLQRLHSCGIDSVRSLCEQSKESLYGAWGGVVGKMWWNWLRGLEWHRPPTRRASVGHSHVLPPEFRNEEGARAVAVRLIHKAAARLRFIGYCAEWMNLYLSFSYREEGWSTDIYLGRTQSTRAALGAFAQRWPHRPVGNPTQIAVTFHRLSRCGDGTLPLFAEDARDAACDRLLDGSNARFGSHALYFAGMFAARDTAPARISFTHIPNLHPAYAG